MCEFTQTEKEVIKQAMSIMEKALKTHEFQASDIGTVKQFCQAKLVDALDEQFCCLFLNSKYELMKFEVLFKGTIDSSSVHPRVVVRKALELNAAAIIFCHNHPSGNSEPSPADQEITKRLKDILKVVDVRFLDHIIVGSVAVSMAELGLI